MKLGKALLIVAATAGAISISNAQTTTSTTTGARITTSSATGTKSTAKQAEKPMAPAPKTPEELRQLDYFVGAWQCTGKNLASGDSPERATSARVDISWELAGNWLVVHYNEAMTSANQNPISGQEHEGWDANQKKFVLFWADNKGGFQSETSPGWDGDKMVWEGPLHFGADEPVKGRDTYTKKSASEMSHTGDLDLKGSWSTMDTEDCKRIKPAKSSSKKSK